MQDNRAVSSKTRSHTQLAKLTLKDLVSALAQEETKVEQHPIEYAGTAITLPPGMSFDEGIRNLERRRDYENQKTRFTVEVEAFPQDGAVALQRVLAKRYGWAHSVPTPGFFGSEPPMMVTVETGVNESMQVPWGRFELPGIKGWIATGVTKRKGRVVFMLYAEVLRKHESEVKAIGDEVRQEILTNSIYRGKAVKLSFDTESSPWDGDTRIANITFMDLNGIDEDSLVYSKHVKDAIFTNLITPLRSRDALKRFGIPFKRGVLLAGIYGTGKTLAAHYAAKVATENGVMFVYIDKAEDFAEAIDFVRQYQPGAVFCEDIDSVTSGDRNSDMNAILNIVDGIDSKATDIMVVLTTNNVGAIHQGMLRPGRLDAVIEVEPPDADAVQRLIRLYGRGLVAQDADLSEIGSLLNGQIPAVVREVIERAKLDAIRLGSFSEDGNLLVTGDALVASALTMHMQISLLNRKPELPPSELEKFGTAFGKSAAKGLEMVAKTLSDEGRMLLLMEPSENGTFDAVVDKGQREGTMRQENDHYGKLEARLNGQPSVAMDALSLP